MSSEGLFIDHVIYGVQDVDATARRLREQYGLGSISAGIHLGGTTNRIVPLEPPVYLELLGIGDTTKADGAWLEQTLQGEDRVLWWVLGVDDLDETARRRGLPVQHGTMQMADGSHLGFRTAGMNRYPLPFFIEYDIARDERAALMAGRAAAAEHDRVPGAFTFAETGDQPVVLDAWLGEHGLPVRHGPGGPGVHAVGIATDRGEITIR